MASHLMKDLQNAYLQLVQLSGTVEQMIEDSVAALVHKDHAKADRVIAADSDVDRREVHIEETCLTMLALHQPVAADLRRITMMLKINNDLEQMADLACNIAERTKSINGQSAYRIPVKIAPMAAMVCSMVKESMNAFVNSDSQLAYHVLESDDQVDALNVEVIQAIEGEMQSANQKVSEALHCFSASRHLEQIADHATSIAEDVIYMADGDIVRHRRTLSEESVNAKE